MIECVRVWVLPVFYFFIFPFFWGFFFKVYYTLLTNIYILSSLQKQYIYIYIYIGFTGSSIMKNSLNIWMRNYPFNNTVQINEFLDTCGENPYNATVVRVFVSFFKERERILHHFLAKFILHVSHHV